MVGMMKSFRRLLGGFNYEAVEQLEQRVKEDEKRNAAILGRWPHGLRTPFVPCEDECEADDAGSESSFKDARDWELQAEVFPRPLPLNGSEGSDSKYGSMYSMHSILEGNEEDDEEVEEAGSGAAGEQQDGRFFGVEVRPQEHDAAAAPDKGCRSLMTAASNERNGALTSGPRRTPSPGTARRRPGSPGGDGSCGGADVDTAAAMSWSHTVERLYHPILHPSLSTNRSSPTTFNTTSGPAKPARKPPSPSSQQSSPASSSSLSLHNNDNPDDAVDTHSNGGDSNEHAHIDVWSMDPFPWPPATSRDARMSHWLEWLSDNEEDLRVHGVDVRHVMLLVDPHAEWYRSDWAFQGATEVVDKLAATGSNDLRTRQLLSMALLHRAHGLYVEASHVSEKYKSWPKHRSRAFRKFVSCIEDCERSWLTYAENDHILRIRDMACTALQELVPERYTSEALGPVPSRADNAAHVGGTWRKGLYGSGGRDADDGAVRIMEDADSYVCFAACGGCFRPCADAVEWFRKPGRWTLGGNRLEKDPLVPKV